MIDFAQLWSYRELLYFLAWRDLKVDTTDNSWGRVGDHSAAVYDSDFNLVFGRLACVPSEEVPYPVLFTLAVALNVHFDRGFKQWQRPRRQSESIDLAITFVFLIGVL